MTPTDCFVYVSNADSQDIRVLALDGATSTLAPVQTVPLGGQVMPLALAPDRRHLYAALRSLPYTVVTLRRDEAGGELREAGRAPLPESMAFIATDRSGRWLFGVSYGGHCLSVSPIGADGVARPATQVLPTGRNAHAVLVAPDGRRVFVSNLGDDQVQGFAFDAATGALRPDPEPAFRARAGSGPRHFACSADGRHVYLLGELDASLDLLARDPASGRLEARQTVSTLPPGFAGKPWAADLHLSPGGRWLFSSERTGSTLAGFAVDGADGTLRPLGHTATEAQPRGFAISPDGRHLVAAGQASDAVTLYAIDAANGGLTPRARQPVGRNPNWVEIVARDAINR